MADIYKIATLNINGLASQTRLAMLRVEDFMRKQEIDIIHLEEVTPPVFDIFRGYAVYTKIGTIRHGTAILTREHMSLTNVVRLPTGMGMTAEPRS